MNTLYDDESPDMMPELVRSVCFGTVDLCYFQPPFISKRNYDQILNNIVTKNSSQARAFTDSGRVTTVPTNVTKRFLINQKGERSWNMRFRFLKSELPVFDD